MINCIDPRAILHALLSAQQDREIFEHLQAVYLSQNAAKPDGEPFIIFV